MARQAVGSKLDAAWLAQMCQVRVGKQKVTSLAALAGGGKVEGPKSDQAVREEIHFWIMWYSLAWQAQHVPSMCWATV